MTNTGRLPEFGGLLMSRRLKSSLKSDAKKSSPMKKTLDDDSIVKDSKDPKHSTDRENPVDENFNWQTLLVALSVMLASHVWLHTDLVSLSGEKLRETTQIEFFETELGVSDVKKLIVSADLGRVSVYYGENAVPQAFFTIGSVESFERALDAAQNQMPLVNKIPVVYEHVNVTKRGFRIIENMPVILMGIYIIYAGARMLLTKFLKGPPGLNKILTVGKSPAKIYNADGTATKVRLADVAGMDEAREEIAEFVHFLRDPEKFTKLGAKIPRGAIISGPPGTGKTLLAKAVAGECDVPFLSVSGSDFVEMFVGVGSSRVRDLFAEARSMAPCILFIDEIDAIGKKRGGRVASQMGSNDERESTLNQLLVEMDGFQSGSSDAQVVVLAATNRPDVLDSALTRPGRFDRSIVVSLPDLVGRKEVFRVHMRPLKLSCPSSEKVVIDSLKENGGFVEDSVDSSKQSIKTSDYDPRVSTEARDELQNREASAKSPNFGTGTTFFKGSIDEKGQLDTLSTDLKNEIVLASIIIQNSNILSSSGKEITNEKYLVQSLIDRLKEKGLQIARHFQHLKNNTALNRSQDIAIGTSQIVDLKSSNSGTSEINSNFKNHISYAGSAGRIVAGIDAQDCDTGIKVLNLLEARNSSVDFSKNGGDKIFGSSINSSNNFDSKVGPKVTRTSESNGVEKVEPTVGGKILNDDGIAHDCNLNIEKTFHGTPLNEDQNADNLLQINSYAKTVSLSTKQETKLTAMESLVELLARQTPGFSGADIANACNEAALIAARKGSNFVEPQHFEAAIERVIAGSERRTRVLSSKELRTVAYHEAGHVVVSWFLRHADPLLKVSIVPRGSSALGYAQYIPEELFLHSREQLLDRMCTLLGGRAAENIFFGTITTGAADDLEKVSRLAHAQITHYGMSSILGNVTYTPTSSSMSSYEDGRPSYSEETARIIDIEVRTLIESAYKRAVSVIEERRELLVAFAERLIEREVLSASDCVELLGPRPV